MIYQPESIPKLHEMLSYFEKRAKESGLQGITFISQAPKYARGKVKRESLISYSIYYEPNYTLETYSLREICKEPKLLKQVGFKYIIQETVWGLKRLCKSIIGDKMFPIISTRILDYDAIWEIMLKRECTNKSAIPGVFVNYDTSPRKGYRGHVIKGYSPDKFGKYFEKMLFKTHKEYKKDVVFLMAWNEWGEGAYLEPDYNDKSIYNVYKDIECNNELIGTCKFINKYEGIKSEYVDDFKLDNTNYQEFSQYKFTFKKDQNKNYYFIKTEQIK